MNNNKKLPEPGKLTNYMNKKYLFMYGEKDIIGSDENFKLLQNPRVLEHLENLLNEMIKWIANRFSDEEILSSIDNADLNNFGFTEEEINFIKNETKSSYETRQSIFGEKNKFKKIKERRNKYE